jgi:hypothetical protein
MNVETEMRALYDQAESLLMAWLNEESPADKHRQQALAQLAEAGQLLHVACINLRAAMVAGPP